MSAAKFHVGQRVKRIASPCGPFKKYTSPAEDESYKKGFVFTIARIVDTYNVLDENGNIHFTRNIAPLDETKPLDSQGNELKVGDWVVFQFTLNPSAPYNFNVCDFDLSKEYPCAIDENKTGYVTKYCTKTTPPNEPTRDDFIMAGVKPQSDLSDIIKTVQAALDEYAFKQTANTARIATHLMQGLIVKIGGVE